MSRAEAARRGGAPRHSTLWHMCSLFSFVLLLGCACGTAHSLFGPGSENIVQLFVPKKTKMPVEVGGKELTKDFGSFDSPFLAAGSGVMVALAEAHYSGSGEKNVGIVARYIETEGPIWTGTTTEKNEDSWKPQLVLKKEGTSRYTLKTPTAVIKGDKIYLLALNEVSEEIEYHFELAVGEISSEGRSKTVKWNTSEPLLSQLKDEAKGKDLSVFSAYAHSAFLTSKGTILFSVNARKKEYTSGFAIMQLKDEKQWEVSFVENSEYCSFISFFEWEEKLIGLLSSCSHSNDHVKEYDEAEKEWKDFTGTLLRLWDGKKELRNFIPVTVGDKKVLLFIGISSKEIRDPDEEWEIHLWVTDGNRVHDAGVVATHENELTSGGLVYTDDELFFLHRQKDENLGTVVFTRLNQQLENVKSVLQTWDKNDARLLKPCNSAGFPGTHCAISMLTDGLVGFLSNKNNDTHWQDEYRFENAAVKGGVKVKNGFAFSEDGAGAQWSVGRSGFGRRYDFETYGLTVVATVTIHEIPKGDTPLLTVDRDEDKKRLGLWYKDNQWKVVSMDDKGEAIVLETQKAYSVALILHNNTISAYIDGKLLGGPLQITKPDAESFNTGYGYGGFSGDFSDGYSDEYYGGYYGGFSGGYATKNVIDFDIENVFIGRYDSGSGINMTVTNVLLYSRVLNGTELETVKEAIAAATTASPPQETASPRHSEQEAVSLPHSVQETANLTNSVQEAANPPHSVQEVVKELDPAGKMNLSSTGLGDSYEPMCVGASLLLLLALRVFELFFLAPI